MQTQATFHAKQTLLLLGSLHAQLQALPELAQLLASARRFTLVPEHLPRALGWPHSLAAIKLASVADQHAVSLDATLTGRRLCCADMAQFRVEPSGVLVLGIGEKSGGKVLSAEQLQALRAFFLELDIASFQITADQWVLELPNAVEPPNALLPSELIGRALNELLPKPAFWTRLLNESQMLFAQIAGLGVSPSIPNSFWFYGADSSTQQAQAAPLAIKLAGSSDDSILRGLEKLSVDRVDALTIIDARSAVPTRQQIESADWLSFDSGECFQPNRWRRLLQRMQFWRAAPDPKTWRGTDVDA